MKVDIKNGSWNNFVAFRDKLITDAQERHEGLEIHCEGKVMSVPLEELETRVKFKKPYQDKFGRGGQQLCYYWWNPDKTDLRQKRLDLKKDKVAKAFKDYNQMSEQEQWEFRNRN